MAYNDTILSFDEVSFEFDHNKKILDEVSFSVRRGRKITIMGQNGAGKSTILKLITYLHMPDAGYMNLVPGVSVATAQQVIQLEDRDLTVTDFFQKYYGEHAYDIDAKIDAVLEVVNFSCPHDRIVRSFSGGQQARLLLASALIQNPDLLLLDEPTNNLDKAGIAHLTAFLQNYKKTVMVISHDADFLNSFTDGVLYLDVHTKKVEQYDGNYLDVQEDIKNRISKENMKNARLAKVIQDNKDKSNFFANKGGGMRLVAKRMREKAAEMEEEMVDVRREDKTIRPFVIPSQPGMSGTVVKITSFKTIRNHKASTRKCELTLRKNQHLILVGPNGIGKSTLLEALATGTAEGSVITPDISVGYYRQDFSTLNFEETALESLTGVNQKHNEERVRSVAASFLITGDVINTKIGHLSEGQKGLVAFARLVLQEPGLLILDEPTNHINFRHLPIIAAALNKYDGAMILVSHVPEFVAQIRIDETLDLDK